MEKFLHELLNCQQTVLLHTHTHTFIAIYNAWSFLLFFSYFFGREKIINSSKIYCMYAKYSKIYNIYILNELFDGERLLLMLLSLPMAVNSIHPLSLYVWKNVRKFCYLLSFGCAKTWHNNDMKKEMNFEKLNFILFLFSLVNNAR